MPLKQCIAVSQSGFFRHSSFIITRSFWESLFTILRHKKKINSHRFHRGPVLWTNILKYLLTEHLARDQIAA